MAINIYEPIVLGKVDKYLFVYTPAIPDRVWEISEKTGYQHVGKLEIIKLLKLFLRSFDARPKISYLNLAEGLDFILKYCFHEDRADILMYSKMEPLKKK